MATSQVTVTVESLAPENGTRLTPVWVGFHDGQFQTFEGGEEASAGLEAIAEDGNIAPLSSEFLASGSGTVDGVVGGAPIAPGAEVSQTFTLDPNAVDSRYLNYASMVLPSNDTFIGNEDSRAIAIFDENGNFVGANFVVPGAAAYDAGTEVNDELPANTAFFGQATPNTGVDENGVVTLSDGFLPAGSGGILDAADFAAGDFTISGYEFARITITLDKLFGDNSDETLFGSDTDNIIRGAGGADSIYGLDGDDTLYGGRGDDTILGGEGDDRLVGNKGNDILDGGAGDDTYLGGLGADTFVLRQGEGLDVIRDFDASEGDLIQLSGGLTVDDLTITPFRSTGATLSVNGEDIAIIRNGGFENITPEIFTEVA